MGVSRNGVLKSLLSPGVPLMKHEGVVANILVLSVPSPHHHSFLIHQTDRK